MRIHFSIIVALLAGLAMSARAQGDLVIPTAQDRSEGMHSPAENHVVGNIVISQIYGGGGNAGATYTHDFIEIFNRGTSTLSLSGWSVQYASATGSTWQVTNLTNVALPPGTYFLIQEAQGAGGITPLPTPDAVGTIAMSSTAGKVALVNTQTALSGTCPSGANIIDFVGYGSTATCFEGSGPTPTLSNTTVALRGNNGCSDTDDNAANFATGPPNPRNTASPPNVCPPTGVRELTPTSFSLSQNYPNPFNPETEIRFSVESAGRASVVVYDLLGRTVAMLHNEFAEPGNLYSVRFNAAHLPSGVYFYKLQAGPRMDMKRMLLLK